MSAKRSRSRTIDVASDRNLAMELVRVTEGAAIAAPQLLAVTTARFSACPESCTATTLKGAATQW